VPEYVDTYNFEIVDREIARSYQTMYIFYTMTSRHFGEIVKVHCSSITCKDKEYEYYYGSIMMDLKDQKIKTTECVFL